MFASCTVASCYVLVAAVTVGEVAAAEVSAVVTVCVDPPDGSIEVSDEAVCTYFFVAAEVSRNGSVECLVFTVAYSVVCSVPSVGSVVEFPDRLSWFLHSEPYIEDSVVCVVVTEVSCWCTVDSLMLLVCRLGLIEIPYEELLRDWMNVIGIVCGLRWMVLGRLGRCLRLGLLLLWVGTDKWRSGGALGGILMEFR